MGFEPLQVSVPRRGHARLASYLIRLSGFAAIVSILSAQPFSGVILACPRARPRRAFSSQVAVRSAWSAWSAAWTAARVAWSAGSALPAACGHGLRGVVRVVRVHGVNCLVAVVALLQRCQGPQLLILH